MERLKAPGAIVLCGWLFLTVAAAPAYAADTGGLSCDVRYDERSSVVNFSGFRWRSKARRVRKLDPYEFASAAHVLMIQSAGEMSWDGGPVELSTLPEKLGKLTGRGTRDMTLKILIDERVDFALAYRVIHEVNKANICDFSIRNMRFHSAFTSHPDLPDQDDRLFVPGDIPEYGQVLTVATAGFFDSSLILPDEAEDGGDCASYYGRTKMDSSAMLELLRRRIALHKQEAGKSALGSQGLSDDRFLSRTIFLQAPGKTPWRCTAGVLWNVKEAGYTAVTLRILPD